MSDHSVLDRPGNRPSISIDTAAVRLTDTILGYNEEDLANSLKAIAAGIGVAHISYIRFASDKSSDTSMLTAAMTYSREWQLRYFFKEYIKIDPVIAHGRHAVLPFDWQTLFSDDPGVTGFFADAVQHNIGRNGISIPVRNRKGVSSVVSFTSNVSRSEWEDFKTDNMVKLQLLSVLIDFSGQYQFETRPGAGQPVPARGAMPDLGRAGQNLPGNRGHSEPGLRQREDPSGSGAPQIALHEPHPRGRRRRGDRGDPAEGPAGLAWRVALGLTSQPRA